MFSSNVGTPALLRFCLYSHAERREMYSRFSDRFEARVEQKFIGPSVGRGRNPGVSLYRSVQKTGHSGGDTRLSAVRRKVLNGPGPKKKKPRQQCFGIAIKCFWSNWRLKAKAIP